MQIAHVNHLPLLHLTATFLAQTHPISAFASHTSLLSLTSVCLYLRTT